MCGRFALTADLKSIRLYFHADLSASNRHFAGEWVPRFNIAPTQMVPVILKKDGKNWIEFLKWGLIPSWSQDPRVAFKMINARSETVDIKPAYREAFRYRRCIVPANSFYEWKVTGDLKKSRKKTPFKISVETQNEDDLIGFAGLWENGTFTILTTDAAPELSELHHRMPVILKEEDFETWLGSENPNAVKTLLAPYRYGRIHFHEVSPLVNSPKNDRVECFDPPHLAHSANPEDSADPQTDQLRLL